MTWMNLWNCQQPWHDTFGQSWALLQETPPSLSHPAAAAAAVPTSIDQHKLFPLKGLKFTSRSIITFREIQFYLKPVGNTIFQLLIQLAAILWIIQIDSVCRNIRTNIVYCLRARSFFLKSVAHTNYITVKRVSADI